MTRIADVRVYALKLPHGEAYLGRLDDGSDLTEDRGYVVREAWRSLHSARFETLLVRVLADDGTEGWGEALAPVGPEVPGQADALAAVDIALWDLAGRRGRAAQGHLPVDPDLRLLDHRGRQGHDRRRRVGGRRGVVQEALRREAARQGGGPVRRPRAVRAGQGGLLRRRAGRQGRDVGGGRGRVAGGGDGRGAAAGAEAGGRPAGAAVGSRHRGDEGRRFVVGDGLRRAHDLRPGHGRRLLREAGAAADDGEGAGGPGGASDTFTTEWTEKITATATPGPFWTYANNAQIEEAVAKQVQAVLVGDSSAKDAMRTAGDDVARLIEE